MKKTIALIFGGEGAERHISELSAAGVIKKIQDEFNLLTVGIDPSGNWYLFDGEPYEIESGEWIKSANLIKVFPARFDCVSGFYTPNGKIITTDLAFPVLHGDFGEDGTIQGALRTAHIPYIGSDVLPSALTSDKAFTKIMAEHLEIPTLPWFVPNSDNCAAVRREAERRLGYPFFIKPRTLGSSIGAAAVYSRKDFAKAFTAACSVAGESGIMIESLADIKAELELALFDNGDMRFISNPGAIFPAEKFYDFKSKYESSDTKVESKPKLPKATVRKAKAMARRLADFLGLKNLSRIDFFLTPGGELYFNEINSIPGMTETSLYPSLAELNGKLTTSFVASLALGKLIE